MYGRTLDARVDSDLSLIPSVGVTDFCHGRFVQSDGIMEGVLHMPARYILAGLLLMALGSAALAQAPGILDEKVLRAEVSGAKDQQLQKVTFPGGSCDLYLLAQEDVQNELNLSADQVARIRGFVADLIEKKRTLSFEEHVKQLRKNQQSALGLLKQDQIQRLRQVSLQCGATASFWDPLVRQELQVSEEQYKEMAAVPYAKDGGDEKAEKVALIRKDFFEYPKRAEEEWQHREWRRLAVLTPRQRVKWKEMLGQPFKGTFPSAVLVPAMRTRPERSGAPSLEELKAEIKTLREKLRQMEKRLAEIERSSSSRPMPGKHRSDCQRRQWQSRVPRKRDDFPNQTEPSQMPD